MSFDVFVARFRDADEAPFDRANFETIFGRRVVEKGHHFLRLRYPDESGAEVYIDDGEEIWSVMFNRCGGDSFWQDVYELAKSIGGVIWWPNVDHISAVASAEVLQHLPRKFVDEAAAPTVIANGHELVAAIGRS